MELFQESILPLIQGFIQKQASIDWQIIAADEDRKEFVEQDITRILHNLALLPGMPEDAKLTLLGKLTVLQAQLSYFGNDEKHVQSFIKTGKALEDLLRDVLQRNNIVDGARERMEDIEEFEESLEDGTATLEQLDNMRPALVLMSVFGILMADKELPEGHEHDNNDSCESECEEDEA